MFLKSIPASNFHRNPQRFFRKPVFKNPSEYLQITSDLKLLFGLFLLFIFSHYNHMLVKYGPGSLEVLPYGWAFLSTLFYIRGTKYLLVKIPGTCIYQSNTNLRLSKNCCCFQSFQWKSTLFGFG